MIDVFNPATGEIRRSVAEDTPVVLAQKFARAKEAQKSWASLSLQVRIQCIEAFRALIEAEKPILAKVLTLDVGKPISQSLSEIDGARARAAFFVEQAPALLREGTIRQTGNTREVLAYEAHGVVVCISAWNYPYLVAMNVIIPALIAGNSVIYKPSEFALQTGEHIASLMHKAGVPEDVFVLAIGGGSVGRELTKLAGDAYFFTGSHATGVAIAQAISSRLVPFGLELGGKDPAYVADDVKNLDAVAASVADGCFYNSGQSCCAIERVYVNRAVYDAFLPLFLKHVRSFVIGDPFDAATYLGPVARAQHLDMLDAHVADAIAHGGRLLLGGARIERAGNYFEPTVIVDLPNHARLMQEETFGPVKGIIAVDSDEEALQKMADCSYGLTAAVYSQDESRGRSILNALDTGTGYWNCCDRVSPYLPWSGRRQSGHGATLSYLGLLAFVRPKAFHLRRI